MKINAVAAPLPNQNTCFIDMKKRGTDGLIVTGVCLKIVKVRASVRNSTLRNFHEEEYSSISLTTTTVGIQFVENYYIE